MKRKLEKNINKVYWMVFFRSALVVAAVFVPLLQKHGLSMAQIMQTQALFALTVALSEIPSGYLADLWGRKNTLIIGTAINAGGFVWLVFADSFVDFLLYEFLLGIGMSLNSGADLALLYDTQNYLIRSGWQGAKRNAVAKYWSMEGLAGAMAALLAGILALWSLQAIVIAQAIVSILPFIVAITLIEPPRQISINGHRENALQIKEVIVSQPLVLFTAVAMIVFGLAAMFAFWLYQKYWELQHVPLTCFGYLWAVHCVIRGLSAHYAHAIEARLGVHKALALIAVLSIAGFAAMGLTGGILGICLAFTMPISRGLSSVIFTDALNKRLDAEFRATVNSIVSLGFRGTFIVTAPLLGLLVDNYGVNVALLSLAVIFLPLYIAVLSVLFTAIKHNATAKQQNAKVVSA